MDQKDMRALAREFAPVVREYVGEAVAPLVRRLEALEARQSVVPKDGVGIAGALKNSDGLLVLTLSNGQTVETGIRDGVDGNDADVGAIAKMIDDVVKAAVAEIPPAEDGKDVDPGVVKAMVADEVRTAVAALPPPRDGVDADPEALAAAVKTEVAAAVGKFDAAFRAEVPVIVAEAVTEALKTIELPEAPKPVDARDVASAIAPVQAEVAILRSAVESIPALPEIPDIPALVEASVAAAVGAIEPPAIDWTEVEGIVARAVPVAVEQAVAAIPKPMDGKDVTLADVAPLVEDAVSRAVAAIPKAKDGVGLAGAVINRDGVLTLTLTDGTTRDLGVVTIDKDAVLSALRADIAAWPRPKDGVDGFGFDDMTVEQDGERTFVWRFVRGDREKEFRFDLPVVIDRGVWREGTYKRGDGVTLGGCFFIAQRDTTAKPVDGTGSDDWRMAARKGRDGKSVMLNDVKPMVDKAVAVAVAAAGLKAKP